MIEPITFNTSLLMAASTLGVVLAAVSPAHFAPDIAAVLMGFCGGLFIQGWTKDKRKPTRTVMLADLGASTFSGYVSRVIGVPTCVACVNYWLPEKLQIVFDPTNHIGFVIVFAGIAGMAGVGILRKGLDYVNPGWNDGNATN